MPCVAGGPRGGAYWRRWVQGDHPAHADRRSSRPAQVPQRGPPRPARGTPATSSTAAASPTLPACAGTTTYGSASSAPGKDYPRMRGDHSPVRRSRPRGHGPPPHARGPQGAGALALLLARTTPACAGTTVLVGDRHAQGEDHPRMRGDHARRRCSSPPSSGPPPHARGPPHRLRAGDERVGTTPACAGTTLPDLRSYGRVTEFCFTRTRRRQITEAHPATIPTHPPPHIPAHPQLTADAPLLVVPRHNSTLPLKPDERRRHGNQRRGHAVPRDGS